MAPPHLSPILDEPTLKRLAEQLAPEIARNGNGRKRGDDWLRWLLGLALAAFIAYLTTISTMDKAISTIDERENNHFAEVLRRLDAMAADVRELRAR